MKIRFLITWVDLLDYETHVEYIYEAKYIDIFTVWKLALDYAISRTEEHESIKSIELKEVIYDR